MNISMSTEKADQFRNYLRDPVFQPSNMSVMSKMLQFAMETFLAGGSSTEAYSAQEAMILTDVESKLRKHFLIGKRQTLSVSSLTVFFKRMDSYLEQMGSPEGLPASEGIHESYSSIMMLSVDWGLVTGMIDVPDNVTRH